MSQAKERILMLLNTVPRIGMDKVVDFLLMTDFFTAPASTKHHNSFEGGLAEHSLAVYKLLEVKRLQFEKLFDSDTCIITALLHDICKVNYYAKEKKNVKKGTKLNDWGKEVANWVEEEVYVVNDSNPLGHGEKSVMMIMEHMKLTTLEQMMIRWHMGLSEPKENYWNLNHALEIYPAIALIHTADMEASYLIDKRSGE